MTDSIETALDNLTDWYNENIQGPGFELKLEFNRVDGVGEGNWPNNATCLITLANWEGEDMVMYARNGDWSNPLSFSDLINDLIKEVFENLGEGD